MADLVLGYCKECGIAVTEKNEGVLEPKVLCMRCYQEELERAEEAAKAALEEEVQKIRHEQYKRESMRKKRNLSMIVGGMVAFAILLTMVIVGANKGSFGTYFLLGIVLGYFGFTFTASMFFDGVVQEIVFDIGTKSIEFPGLIFSLDLDGIMWLISVKILFAIIGFFGGILFAVLGVLVGAVVSGVTYPFSLIHQNMCIATGNEEDFD